MELASERSSDEGGLKQEKRSDYTAGDDDDGHKQEIIVKESTVANTERSILEAGPSASPNKKEEVDDLLETTKAEMGVVREENQQLKMNLNKIMNEYRTLEMQFQDILKQGAKNKDKKRSDDNPEEILEESDDLVSLSLGRVPSNPKSDEKIKVCKPLKERFNEELSLGLDCKFETSKSESTNEGLPNVSPENSSEVPKEEGVETWPPGKALKTIRETTEDEVADQNPPKKPRVCVRARCETPTMNDGCQWRKYGQKIAKGNPCPRAYYRCTIAPSCPVRKQVQRCAQDMSILITTYEGTHNHNLPPSATAMASTTSAAASMLLTGSSTSNTSSIPSSTTNNLQGLNFYLSDSSKPRQIYLSNPALSSSPSHPTITLDLTSHTPSNPFVRFNQPKYPSSSSLSFSTTSTQQPYNNNNILSSSSSTSVNFGRQQMENFYQSYMQKNIINNNYSNLPQSDTISAATKVITADPTFQSALAAALSSFIGGGGNTRGNHSASSFMNNTPAKKSFMFVPPSSSLPFSAPKSASASPADNTDTTTN